MQVEHSPQVDLQGHQPASLALFGGTFNPPHLGHLIMAEFVLEALRLDHLYFLPTYQPPHQDYKATLSADHRLEMLGLALGDNPKLKIEPYEVNQQTISYTIDTIRALRKIYPKTSLYFVIGADMVEYLPTWRAIDDLVQLVHFVALKRPSYDGTDSPYPILWVDAPLIDISSSMIRERVQRGESIRYLVPEKVRAYIEKEALYHEPIK